MKRQMFQKSKHRNRGKYRDNIKHCIHAPLIHDNKADVHFFSEEKLVSLLVYSSSRGVPTRNLPKTAVFTSSGSAVVKVDWI